MFFGISLLVVVSLVQNVNCVDTITDAALLELTQISRGLNTKLDIKKIEATDLPVGPCKSTYSVNICHRNGCTLFHSFNLIYPHVYSTSQMLSVGKHI